MNFYVGLFHDSAVARIERYGAGEPGAEGSVKRADFIVAGQRDSVGNILLACS